jgi:hypothetical protein
MRKSNFSQKNHPTSSSTSMPDPISTIPMRSKVKIPACLLDEIDLTDCGPVEQTPRSHSISFFVHKEIPIEPCLSQSAIISRVAITNPFYDDELEHANDGAELERTIPERSSNPLAMDRRFKRNLDS